MQTNNTWYWGRSYHAFYVSNLQGTPVWYYQICLRWSSFNVSQILSIFPKFGTTSMFHDVVIYLVANLSTVVQGKVYKSPEFQNSPLDQKGIFQKGKVCI